MDYVNAPQTDGKNAITFIFGNGFDLNLRLKTRFKDMYDEYIETSSIIDAVNQFKEDLKSDSKKKYYKWSDFEMSMADYAKKLSSEEELIQCTRDFKDHMVEHLKNENKRFREVIYNLPKEIQADIANEVNDSFDNFYLKLVKKKDIRKISALHQNPFQKEYYITFNYTKTLETILEYRKRLTKLEDPIHIHGDLDNHIILGVDNMDQINGAKYKFSNRGKRCFLKPFLNNELDDLFIEDVKKVISDSSVICIYGFSMGESDRMWNELIAQWLNSSPQHHLVVFEHNTDDFQGIHIDLIMEHEEQQKLKVMKKLGIEKESKLDQIHIPIGKSIFNFDFWTGVIDSHFTNEDTEKMLAKI